MRTLAVLLGASILLNLVLIVRRSAPPPEPPKRPAPARAVAAAPAAAPSDPEVLVLRTRVRELEAERLALPALDVAPDPRAAFREKLARALKLWRDPKAQASAPPEAHLELSEVALELQRAKLTRFKDPKGYVDTLRTVLDAAALDLKKPLSEAQREALRRSLDDYETSLAGLETADSWERYLREVGPEAEQLQRLKALVPPEMEARTMAFGGLSPWTGATAPWVDRTQAETHVVQQWMWAYGLEDAQKPAVAAAARLFLNASDALNAQMAAAAAPGRETPEWRLRTARNLLDALGSLESSLTPEQRERLRGRRPAEVRIYDALRQQRYAR